MDKEELEKQEGITDFRNISENIDVFVGKNVTLRGQYFAKNSFCKYGELALENSIAGEFGTHILLLPNAGSFRNLGEEYVFKGTIKKSSFGGCYFLLEK